MGARCLFGLLQTIVSRDAGNWQTARAFTPRIDDRVGPVSPGQRAWLVSLSNRRSPFLNTLDCLASLVGQDANLGLVGGFKSPAEGLSGARCEYNGAESSAPKGVPSKAVSRGGVGVAAYHVAGGGETTWRA